MSFDGENTYLVTYYKNPGQRVGVAQLADVSIAPTLRPEINGGSIAGLVWLGYLLPCYEQKDVQLFPLYSMYTPNREELLDVAFSYSDRNNEQRVKEIVFSNTSSDGKKMTNGLLEVEEYYDDPLVPMEYQLVEYMQDEAMRNVKELSEIAEYKIRATNVAVVAEKQSIMPALPAQGYSNFHDHRLRNVKGPIKQLNYTTNKWLSIEDLKSSGYYASALTTKGIVGDNQNTATLLVIICLLIIFSLAVIGMYVLNVRNKQSKGRM